jgi:hypothetical protein
MSAITVRRHVISETITLFEDPAAPRVSIGFDPARGVAAERAYIRAFFDLWLRDRDTHLLDGPSAELPELLFMGF